MFNADGSYTIAYQINVTNGSREPLTAIAIVDDLTAANGMFGTYTSAAAPLPGQYTVSVAPQVTGTLTGVVASYTGETGNGEIVSGGTLHVGATSQVTYSLRVNPEFPRVQPLAHINTADIEGTGQWSGQTTPTNPDLADSDSATATPVFDPEITLLKTAQVDRTGGIVVGSRIDYTFRITNTGNTPLANVELTDPLVDLVWIDGSAIPTLAPGEWVVRTAYYEIKQADVDRGNVFNEADVVGEWGVGSGGPLTVSDTDDEIVAALTDGARRDLSLLPWDGAETLRRRSAYVAAMLGQDDPLCDAALVATIDDWLPPLLTGKRRLDMVTGLHDALEQQAGWDWMQQVRRLAPARFESPAGSSHAIDYAAEGGPRVELRVQALFGLATHPMVAGQPLTLSLTSPAGRPIQTTKDLPGFWAGSWRDVSKEMRGRYPRHPWPDDPAAASATLRTKKADARRG